eukprot:m.37305 g.37305  ORF g.37305 m.37305 type:complete len:641 (+) comp17629_c0_seq1:201-2123(+)
MLHSGMRAAFRVVSSCRRTSGATVAGGAFPQLKQFNMSPLARLSLASTRHRQCLTLTLVNGDARGLRLQPQSRTLACVVRQNNNVFASPYADVPASAPMYTGNIATVVRKNWKTIAQRVACVDAITGEQRTFGEVDRDVDILSVALLNMGVKKRDVVAIIAVNNVDYAATVLALSNIGAVATPCNPSYTPREIMMQLENSNAVCIITHVNNFDLAMDSNSSLNVPLKLSQILVIGPTQNSDLSNSNSDCVFMDNLRILFDKDPNSVYEFRKTHKALEHGDDLCVLPYSSGTTGVPKGVMLSHRNILANLFQYDMSEKDNTNPEVDVLISPLPIFHIYSFTVSMLYSAMKGMTMVTMQRFNLQEFCKAVETHKATRAHLVPPILVQLVNDACIDDYDLSSIKMVTSAAAPLGPELEQRCRERLGCEVKQIWGMSELSPLGTATSDFNLKPGSGTIGPATASTELKIVDVITRQTLPPNHPGELCVRGPQVMLGYLNAPEKTNEILTEDGWLLTGDIAKIDDDGFCYITDRLKELIKYKGFQVAPAELEDILSGHPAVADVTVIPRLCEVAGEIPRAYVVLAEGIEESESLAEELTSLVEKKLAPHKRLRGGICFTDKVPKSATGKLLRRELIAIDRAKYPQ